VPCLLQECATFFLDTNREKIKHAMCALLVEILLPVSAVIKVEASLPVARKFVTMLYNPCFESAKRGKHSTVSLERERVRERLGLRVRNGGCWREVQNVPHVDYACSW